MKKVYLFLAVSFISFLLIACNAQTIKEHKENITKGNPTVADILLDNTDADILLLNGIVYKNAVDIAWVNEEDLTLGKEVAVIKKQTKDAEEFTDGVATKLNVGTKIYKSVGNGNIYIAVVKGKEIRYLGLIEG